MLLHAIADRVAGDAQARRRARDVPAGGFERLLDVGPLGAVHDGMQQVTSGLTSGERVIVDGVQKARPGQKVVAKGMPDAAK